MSEFMLLTQKFDIRELSPRIPKHLTSSVRVVRGMVTSTFDTGVTAEAQHSVLDEDILNIPDEKTARLAEFVSRVVVNKEPLHYNCVTFTSFISGGSTLEEVPADTRYLRPKVGMIREVRPDDLKAGDAYFAYLADQRTAVHSLVGVNDSTEHLGVWGYGSSLAIGDNEDMRQVYNAAHIMRVEGPISLTRLDPQ